MLGAGQFLSARFVESFIEVVSIGMVSMCISLVAWILKTKITFYNIFSLIRHNLFVLLGNETPEASLIVHTEISHIWPGIRTLQGTSLLSRKETFTKNYLHFSF